MLPYPISSTQTDCESPVDDNLMDSIRQDLDYLDSLLALGTNVFHWKIDGDLNDLKVYKGPCDGLINYKEFLPTKIKWAMKQSGIRGSVVFDILANQKINIPIAAINGFFPTVTQSIARVAAYNTQSIAKYTPDISTQSITRAKAQLQVDSIQNVGGTLWEYTVSSAPDADWDIHSSDWQGVFDGNNTPSLYVLVSSATNAGNNGTFRIVEVNRSNHWSIVVDNASGVAEATSPAVIDLQLFSYNFTIPVDSSFDRKTKNAYVRTFALSGHTNAANNITYALAYKINQSGNNIWVPNQNGVTQGAPAGTANSCLWTFALSSAASADDFPDGNDNYDEKIDSREFVQGAGHVSAANNHSSWIVYGRNLGGNNVVMWVASGLGAVQAAPAGTIQPYRWRYARLTAVGSYVSIDDKFTGTGHTSSANDGVFRIKAKNTGGNNFTVYNANGVAQAGAAGSCTSFKRFVYFYSDQSATFNTDSYIELEGVAGNTIYNKNPLRFPYKVLAVNEVTAPNGIYNIIIEQEGGTGVYANTGNVIMEGKSILNAPIEIPAEGVGSIQETIVSIDQLFYGYSYFGQPKQYINGESTDFVGGNILDGQILSLHFKDMMDGQPTTFSAVLY